MYVVFVNPGVPKRDLHHWQGEQPEFGTPKHTTRQIHESPAAFEFATPIAGSYPPWYDPSYWHAGIKIRFDVLQQINVLVKNLVFAWNTFLAALVFGYLALLVGGGRLRPSLEGLGANAVILVPAVVGLGVYLLVTDFPDSDISTQPAMRYIAPFAVLLFAGVLSSVRFPDSRQSLRWLSGITTAAVAVVVASFLASLVQDRLKPRVHRDHVDWEITTHLAAWASGRATKSRTWGPGPLTPCIGLDWRAFGSSPRSPMRTTSAKNPTNESRCSSRRRSDRREGGCRSKEPRQARLGGGGGLAEVRREKRLRLPILLRLGAARSGSTTRMRRRLCETTRNRDGTRLAAVFLLTATVLLFQIVQTRNERHRGARRDPPR